MCWCYYRYFSADVQTYTKSTHFRHFSLPDIHRRSLMCQVRRGRKEHKEECKMKEEEELPSLVSHNNIRRREGVTHGVKGCCPLLSRLSWAGLSNALLSSLTRSIFLPLFPLSRSSFFPPSSQPFHPTDLTRLNCLHTVPCHVSSPKCSPRLPMTRPDPP